MSKAIAEIAIGVALVAGAIALDIIAPEIGIPLSATLLSLVGSAGAGLVMTGVGTLLTQQRAGLSANTRNPIQAWNGVYGQSKIGGVVVYIEETGESDKYLHMVYVLACHPCKSIDALLFDGKRVCLDTSGNSISFQDSTPVVASQQGAFIATISRAGDVVTVVMQSTIGLPASTAAGPALLNGDSLQISNITTDATLNGLYQVQVLSPTSFTYICGGNPVTIAAQGQVVTTWPDYGDTVHMEQALGTQSATAPPFPGLLASGGTGSQGLWTSQHLLQGRTAVYLRLKYGGNTYVNGLPTIAFLVSGKNDIYDPRTSTNGYTTNSALCIADYLTHQTWGFKCAYGTDVPSAPLVAAANLCDEAVTLAIGGTEPRYTCNGTFAVSAKRGEILQNLLTSCAGRLTYAGGQYTIWPGAWTGPSFTYGNPTYTVPGTTKPWLFTGGINAAYPYGFGDSDGTPPVIVPITGASITIVAAIGGVNWLHGTVDAQGTGDYGSGMFEGVYDPTNYMPGSTLGTGGLCGAFTDSTGQVIQPISIGFGGTFSVPAGATQLQLGINDSQYGDNTGSFAVSAAATLVPPFENLAGPFQWKQKLATRDLYNGVKGTYVSPLNSWQISDMPNYAQDVDHGYASDANLTADGGERRWLDIQLPFTISVSTAQRLAKIELLRRRQQGSGTFAFNLAMYQTTALDVISMSLPPLGWQQKLLEVSALRFTVQKQDGNAMTLGTELDLQETSPSVYVWNTSEDLSPSGSQQDSSSGASSSQSVTAPAGVTTASGSTVASTGAAGSSSRILITWTAPTDGFVVNGGYIVVQYQLAPPGPNWTALGTFDPSTTSAYITGVTDGTAYYVRVSYINTAGVQSAWTVSGPITASGSSLSFAFSDNETPGGALDGANQTFTLAATPNPAASLELYLNGDLQLAGIDYSLSGGVVTFVAATPNTVRGDWLRAFYRH